MVDIINLTTQLTTASFSLAEAKSITLPLILFVAGIVVYSIFVFKFYRFL